MNTNLKLVKCEKKYWEFVRKLRNDQRVTDNFIDNTYITKKMQEAFMKLNSNSYRIALYEHNPVGYVGVIENDIRICIHPDYQRKGIGSFMINNIMLVWPNAVAKVKIENVSSIKMFESCGFKKNFFILKKDQKV